MDDAAKIYKPPPPGYPKVNASSRDDLAACPRVPDNAGDPQGVLCLCVAGSIGELSYLRGEPVQRREGTWATTRSREELPAPSVASCVPIMLDVPFRNDEGIAITYLIGGATRNGWAISDKTSLLLKPNDEHGHSVACWGACVLAQGGASFATIMGETLRAIDYAVAEAKQLTHFDEPS